MSSEREIKSEDIRTISVKDFEFEDRDPAGNLYVIIHLEEDAEIDVEHDVLRFSADRFNAETLKQFVAEEE